MAKVIHAIYDGEAFHPIEPVALTKNTQVRIIIETVSSEAVKPRSFLKTARSISIKGPTDWSSRLDTYVYGIDVD